MMVASPTGTPASEMPTSPSKRSRRRAWIVAAAVVALAVVAGSAYAVRTGWGQPKHRHFVAVVLAPGVTAEQRAAVAEHLEDFNPSSGPEFRGADEVLDRADEMYLDDPEAREGIADMGISMMSIMIESPVFDCEPAPALWELPGVQHVTIDGVAERGGRFGPITCQEQLRS
jgi:hypothetical protein